MSGYPLRRRPFSPWRNEDNGYTYEGKKKDLETDLWYNTARYFNNGGRFTQVDPMWMKYPNISPYVRVGDNPIRYLDTDGEKIIEAVGYSTQAGGVIGVGSSQMIIRDDQGNQGLVISKNIGGVAGLTAGVQKNTLFMSSSSSNINSLAGTGCFVDLGFAVGASGGATLNISSDGGTFMTTNKGVNFALKGTASISLTKSTVFLLNSSETEIVQKILTDNHGNGVFVINDKSELVFQTNKGDISTHIVVNRKDEYNYQSDNINK